MIRTGHVAIDPLDTFFCFERNEKERELIRLLMDFGGSDQTPKMARTVRDAKLETRAARARLASRKKPYWKTLVPGRLHLGYRKKSKDQPGTWLARRYVGNERYRIVSLGLADDFDAAAVSYEQAQRLGYEHPFEIEKESHIDLTVAEAIARYVDWLKLHKATGAEVEQRAALHVLPQLGTFKVSELTTHQLNRWRDELAASPALFRPGYGRPRKHKPLAKTKNELRARKVSANKCVTILKAALNRAFREGLVEEDRAWRRFESFHKVEVARERSLNIVEAQRLINAADEPSGFRDLLHAALLTGCRFGELRYLRVKDFANKKLAIRQSKSGKPRHVRLTDEGVALFAELAVGRCDEDYLLMNKRLGREWRKSDQNRPMRSACSAAGISPPVGIHQMRHTWASLSVMNGVPLLVVAANLGHSDTRMVEKHYGHLTDDYKDKAIRAGAPRYGRHQAQQC